MELDTISEGLPSGVKISGNDEEMDGGVAHYLQNTWHTEQLLKALKMTYIIQKVTKIVIKMS